VKVPVSQNPSPSSDQKNNPHPWIDVTDLEYAVRWNDVYRFHVQRSRDPDLTRERRRWHSNQARIIASKHFTEENTVYSWAAHCQAAREAAEAAAISLT
jgi:hypothetical protein